MADNHLPSYRSRNPLAPDQARPVAAGAGGDPLAELARLIGQTDPYAEAEANEVYRDAAKSSGRKEIDAPDLEEREERFTDFADATANEAHDAHEPQHDDGSEAYPVGDHYDETPRPRRGGLAVVLAVLGLAVVGTAGAFAYRTTFGGSVLPLLPPIIKASNGPNKIAPSYGESQASNPNPAIAGTSGSTERLVSREEQPVFMEPPKVAPRVVSTIPIVAGQSAISAAESATPPDSAMPTPSATATPAPAMAAAPAPTAASPAAPAPAGAPSAPAAASSPPANAAVSSGPKKIRTVTIRADQSMESAAVAVPPAAASAASAASAPATRSTKRAPSTAKPSASASALPAGQSVPLSIVPGAEGDATAAAQNMVRASTAGAPSAVVASAAPITGAAAPEPSGGGYAVQLSSQHSEAEAQASFQALRAKFPDQLGSREPIIRRADLGAKGVYYRALVGPFASAEEAAAMCSSLKAAGGKCIVQRN